MVAVVGLAPTTSEGMNLVRCFFSTLLQNGAALLILTTIAGGHPRTVNTEPHKNLERDERIELSTLTWKDSVLPLN